MAGLNVTAGAAAAKISVNYLYAGAAVGAVYLIIYKATKAGR
jgi:hypothetical protein